MTGPMTPPQRGFLESLARERGQVEMVKQKIEKGLSKAEASQLIETLQRMPRPQATTKEVDENLRPGIYEHAGEIYAVRPSRTNKGRLVAYQLIVQDAKHVTEAGEDVGIRFEYAKGMVYEIKPEAQMDLARAQQLSALYRRCIACGAKLEAAKSVRDSLGPVCVKKFRNFERPEVIRAKNVLDEDVEIENKPRKKTPPLDPIAAQALKENPTAFRLGKRRMAA
jgi:hypothetical protein